MRDIKELNNILDGDLGLERNPAGDIQDSAYFNAKADRAGVSGDDVNRRLRERRLGFAEPSSDWDQAGTVVHCIYPGQIPTKSHACIILWDLSTCGPMGFVAESLEEIFGKGVEDPCDDCESWEDGHNNGFCDACGMDDDSMPPAIESSEDAASMDVIKTCLADITRQRDGLRHAWEGCHNDCTFMTGRDLCHLSQSFCDFDGCRRIGN